MQLNATALQNLEILQTSEGRYEGSLLHHLNYTVTPFGFRLFRRWLVAPLYDAPSITRRLDAVTPAGLGMAWHAAPSAVASTWVQT